MNEKDKPLVSVIITTKNEEKNIESCLKSIIQQDYPQEKIEIIVVDNYSLDKTKEIVSYYTEKIYNFGPERSAQRNFGIREARGKYILYLDADMILSSGVIEECVNKCENEGFIALYIPEKIIGNGFWIKVRDFERSFYNATCIDAVRFIRKDKALEIGCFDETLNGPEDWDFDRRIKKAGNVDMIAQPIYHNEHEINLRKYLDKKLYYAQSFERYIQKWGKDDPIIKKQLGLWYRYFGVFIENGEYKKLIKHKALFLGLYFLRIFLGIKYLLNK